MRWALYFNKDDGISRITGTKWLHLTAKDKMNMFATKGSRDMPVIKLFLGIKRHKLLCIK